MHPSAPFAEFVSFFYAVLPLAGKEIVRTPRQLQLAGEAIAKSSRITAGWQGKGADSLSIGSTWLTRGARGPSRPHVAPRASTRPHVAPRASTWSLVALGALKSNSLQVFIDLWVRFEIRDRIAVD